MAYLNVKARTLETKIVYYGAGLSGKTTNLEQVKQRSGDGRSGDMMSLDTDGDRTLFFDYLPFEMGKFNGCEVKLQLYTVPGQAKYRETRKRVLSNADGVVLVLDSQSGALERNRQSLADLREHMKDNRLDPARVPIVLQLNKRDLPSAMDPAQLLDELGLAGADYVEAVASEGRGVMETLKQATRAVVEAVQRDARTGDGRITRGSESGLDGNTMYEQLTAGGRAPTASGPRNGAPAPSPRTAAASPAIDAALADLKKEVASLARQLGKPGTGAPINPSNLNELLAAHRLLVRRVDALEGSFQQSLAAFASDLERRLAERISNALGASLAEAVGAVVEETITSKLEPMRQGLGNIRRDQVELNERLERIENATADSAERVAELRADWAAGDPELLGRIDALLELYDTASKQWTNMDRRLKHMQSSKHQNGKRSWLSRD